MSRDIAMLLPQDTAVAFPCGWLSPPGQGLVHAPGGEAALARGPRSQHLPTPAAAAQTPHALTAKALAAALTQPSGCSPRPPSSDARGLEGLGRHCLQHQDVDDWSLVSAQSLSGPHAAEQTGGQRRWAKSSLPGAGQPLAIRDGPLQGPLLLPFQGDETVTSPSASPPPSSVTPLRPKQ